MNGTRVERWALLLLAPLIGAGPPAPEPQPPPAPDEVAPTAAEMPAAPGPLLREGSFVLQAHGTLRRREPDGWWVFRVERGDRNERLYELTLLPCTLLSSLEELVESMPDQTITFDLSGQVFVYRQRNYLLPTHAPRLVEYVEPPQPPQPPKPAAPPQESAATGADSAEAILRDLDRTVGAVPRSPRAAPSAPTGATASSPGGTRRLVAPGTLMLWRRGWMARQPSGAWSFVFEADATGLGDPPMILMPCLLLGELETHVQRSGPDSPLLISGRVYRYHGRNYLLPTAFQVPLDYSALRP